MNYIIKNNWLEVVDISNPFIYNKKCTHKRKEKEIWVK